MHEKDVNNTSQKLLTFLKRYKKSRKSIRVDFRKLVDWIPYGERATHSMHPYPAKLLVHIPHFFLCSEILSKPGDIVLDPFCGTGTVMLETILCGRNGIGVDINPLACLISNVKTQSIDDKRLRETYEIIKKTASSIPSCNEVNVFNVDYWYYPRVIKGLKCISEAINRISNKKIKCFFLMCFSVLARKVSLADPRISVPVKFNFQKLTKNHHLRLKEEKRLKRIKTVDLLKLFSDIVNTNIKRMVDFSSIYGRNGVSAQIFAGSAQSLSRLKNKEKINDESIDLIITSPPYAGAQKYTRATRLNLGWTGLCNPLALRELERKTIGREGALGHVPKNKLTTGIDVADNFLNKIKKKNVLRAQIAGIYLNEMRVCIKEMYRVLKNNRYLVMVVGDNFVCGKQFKISRYLQLIAESFGFKLRLRLSDSIDSRGLMTKRNKTANMITKEWILLFQKER